MFLISAVHDSEYETIVGLQEMGEVRCLGVSVVKGAV
jgi:hypothetical protein